MGSLIPLGAVCCSRVTVFTSVFTIDSPACSSRPLKSSGHYIFLEGHDFTGCGKTRFDLCFGKGTTSVVPLSPFTFVIPSGLQPARNLLFRVFPQLVQSCH